MITVAVTVGNNDSAGKYNNKDLVREEIKQELQDAVRKSHMYTMFSI